MSEVYENSEFIDDLAVGRAVRSVVYCAGVATLSVYEWGKEFAYERTEHFPAEEVPQVYLKDKFRRITQ